MSPALLPIAFAGLVLLSAGCRSRTPDKGRDLVAEAAKTASAATVRAQRRAYDGAPPVIPHPVFSGACNDCHGDQGVAVPGVGYSPPSPHGRTRGLSAVSRCEQCHVYRKERGVFAVSAFVGLRQDLRHGRRLHPLAPPVIPHQVLMRENCQACHVGPAARKEIRTPHPQRTRCRQCHLEQVTTAQFGR